MARTDWAALRTDPTCEYTACSELQRFGFQPYLPQVRRRHQLRQGKYVLRFFPLFPHYILIRHDHALDPKVRLAKGVCRHRPILADESGRPWRAPEYVIAAVRTAEANGDFDEILHKGDPVTLNYGVLSTIRAVLATDRNTGAVELLTPLFGGARVRLPTKT